MYLLAQLVLYMSLEAPQHEWFEDHVQALQLGLIEARLVLRVILNVLAEPFVKLLVRIKQRRHNEMQQRPQLIGRWVNGVTGCG